MQNLKTAMPEARMQVTVIPFGTAAPTTGEKEIALVHDSWNDWWNWETLYTVFYYDQAGVGHRVGTAKVALEDQEGKIPELPPSFTQPPKGLMSLGQDESYYANVVSVVGSLAFDFLTSLGDLVSNLGRFNRVKHLAVVRESLLRSVSVASVKGQFRRIIVGSVRTKAFELTYIEPVEDPLREAESISFHVDPNAVPPTNIHVLIGRNGSGKTRLLLRMAEALIQRHQSPYHRFESKDAVPIQEAVAGVGYVSFSAFDRQPPLQERQGRGITVFNIGLKKLVMSEMDYDPQDPVPEKVQLKGFAEVLSDMGKALHRCSLKSMERWRAAVEQLETDPMFAEINAVELAEGISSDGLSDNAKDRFRELSSGHQIVLLAVTSLVAHIEERTLVLIDEPEGHLHPPLLSAYVRTLSKILLEANAFAIVATHSPVVLQEVPSKCTYVVERSGNETFIRPPRVETFGENVGVLTREVFGLEVEASGFHRLLRDKLSDAGLTYEEMVDFFNGELGGEALGLLSLYAAHKDGSSIKLEF